MSEIAMDAIMMAPFLPLGIPFGGQPLQRSPSIKIQMGSDTTFFDLFEIIKQSPDSNLDIEFHDGDRIAVGDGVSRQFYLKCIDQIIEIGALHREGRFMTVDPSNGFWNDQENIFCLVKLITFILQGGVLPYHLSPGLLRVIVNQPLADFELEFFLDKKDPEILHRICQPGADAIIVEELGFTDRQDYIQYVLDKNFHPSSTAIYHRTVALYSEIAQAFTPTGLQFCPNAISLDERLSGRYEITNDSVYRIMDLVNKEYELQWKEFIYSLHESELKNMLLTFTNSLSMDHTIKIEVKDIQLDLTIQTCMRTVTINRKLFTNRTLDNLKLSFTGNDTISDLKIVDGHLVPDLDPSIRRPAPNTDRQEAIRELLTALLDEMMTNQ